MKPITVDADDLLVVIRACMELDIDASAYRGVMSDLTDLSADKTLVAKLLGALKNARLSAQDTVPEKYQDVLDEIQHGNSPGDALKKLARYL